MNRFVRHVIKSHRCCFILLIFISGCASLPQVVPVPAEESESVLSAFLTFSKEQCPKDIDADVSLTFDNLLFKGTIRGYLQAMSPAFIRFEGVNPLGLTETVLASDGTSFTFLAVREQKGYVGRLDAKKIRKYVSPEVASSFDYYWLLGRTSPLTHLDHLGKDSNGMGYWLAFAKGDGNGTERILFDPEDTVIRRRMILAKDNGVDVDARYEYAGSGLTTDGDGMASSACRLPSAIFISTNGNGRITLTFQDRYPTGGRNHGQFTVTIPKDFERVTIQ